MANLGFNIRWSDNTDQLKRNLKDGLNQIEATRASVEKLTKSLSGEGAIRAAHNYAAALQKIGGEGKELATIERLTSQERQKSITIIEKAIQKYQLLGKEAPEALRLILAKTKEVEAENLKLPAAIDKSASGFASMFGNLRGLAGAVGIGFGVSQVVNFGKAILSDADALQKMSDRTGISAQWLQKFQIAGDDAGNTVEQLSGAVNKMQDRLAGGDKSAVAALQKLGISLSDIKHLSPEQQFVAIADAIRGVKDPAEQVNIAIDLFGKSGAEILPTIKRGFDDVKDRAVGMSDETVKALDEVGDAWESLKRRMKGITAEIVVSIIRPNAAPGAGGINAAGGDFSGAFRTEQERLEYLAEQERLKDEKAIRDFIQKSAGGGSKSVSRLPTNTLLPVLNGKDIQDALDKLEPLDKQLDKINERLKHQNEIISEQARLTGGDAKAKLSILVEAWNGLTVAQRGNAFVVKNLVEQYEPLRKDLDPSQLPADFEALAKAQRDADAESKRLRDSVVKLEDGLKGLNTATLPGFVNMRKFADEMAAVKKQIDQIEFQAADKAFKPGGLLTGPIPGLKLHTPEEFVPPQKYTFGMALKDSAKTLPQSLINAFTGGGGVAGAFRAIGTDFGNRLFGKDGAFVKFTEKATKSLEGVFGKTIGGALGGALPGIGALIGPAIDGLGKLFGKAFGKIFQTEGKKVNNLRDAFQASFGPKGVGGSLDDLVRGFSKVGLSIEKVRQLLKAGTEKDFKKIVDEFNAATALQKTAFDKLNTAAEKYGFTLAELGPSFRAQKLGEEAAGLYEEFKLLTESGIDTATVLQRMAGVVITTAEDGSQAVTDWGNGFGKLIHDAITTGTALPKQLQPIVEKMIELGLITKEDGSKFGSLQETGLTFTDNMSQGFKDVVESINELTAVLKAGLGIGLSEAEQKAKDLKAALDSLPSGEGILGHVGDVLRRRIQDAYDAANNPETAHHGAFVTAHGLERMHTGKAKVLPFPRFHLGTQEVPAILRVGEAVLNERAADWMGRDTIAALNSGALPAMVHHDEMSSARSSASQAPLPPVLVQLVLDGQVVAEKVVDVAEKDKRGVGSKLRRVTRGAA